MIEIKTGDLLDATEQYIAHQTNVMSSGSAAGIARAIFDRFPYADCYQGRTTPDQPGTIIVRGNDSQRKIININSQLYPGRFNEQYTNDNQKAREQYFYQCLLRIAKIPDLQSIAFPYLIGCGIGGGKWSWYLGQLELFEKFVSNNGVKVSIYRRPGD